MEEKRQKVKNLVTQLSSVSEQTRSGALCELRLLSRNDPETRPLIVAAGAVPYLSETLYAPSPILQENAAAALLNLSISDRQPLMSAAGLLDAVSHVLRDPHSPPGAVQATAATLYSLLVIDENRPVIGSKRDIIFALIDIVQSRKSPPRSIKDALKALFGIALCAGNRGTIIGLGAAAALFNLVVKDGRVGVLEDATAVIAQIAGCEEAEDAFRRVSGVGVLVDLLDPSTGSSSRTKENAVSALLNLVQCGGERVCDHVRLMAFGVVDGIADVAENGSSKGKSKALSLLKLFDKTSNSSTLSGFDTELLHTS